MVREAGIEPARPKAGDFKSPVATITPHSQFNLVGSERLELSRFLAGT